MSVRILVGDALDQLRLLPAESVHCVVTSPPYWGLRDYGVAGQIGLEATVGEYVETMVSVFREVRRVLRSDGICWLNLGDCYAGSSASGWRHGNSDKNKGNSNRNGVGFVDSLKPKDLVGVPWRVAFALQADGWWLRKDIIWHKPNPMPESTRDRPTTAHEYLFLLAKSERYFYDAEAISEDVMRAGEWNNKIEPNKAYSMHLLHQVGATRNKRSVWTIATHPYPEAHFATFPPALVEPCIRAGTSERGVCAACGAPWVRVVDVENDDRRPYATVGAGKKAKEVRNDCSGFNKVLREDGRGGDLAKKKKTTTSWSPSCSCDAATVPATVLDPFAGSLTTSLVSERLRRDSIAIELNPDYVEMGRSRLKSDSGMFFVERSGAFVQNLSDAPACERHESRGEDFSDRRSDYLDPGDAQPYLWE